MAYSIFALTSTGDSVSAVFQISICGAETVSPILPYLYFTTEQASSGTLEITWVEYGSLFQISGGVHVDCEVPTLTLLDTSDAALNNPEVTVQVASDGNPSIMIDRSSAFAEIQFKIQITTPG